MYKRFFGLNDQPFRLTPDPRYLYLGSRHREGYAHLLYGLQEGSGFVAITGEVGTGKTTLVRALLRGAGNKTAIAYLFNPLLSTTELLQTINAEFGLPSRTTNKKELVELLNDFLLTQRGDGARSVVIVDEAQNLDPAVLEELRLLSNLETETDKLLQIILLGQPELRSLLDRSELRQLAQRITLRWHLEALDRHEAHSYVAHRLRVAGGDANLFDEKALDLVYDHSGGIPRLINILAHRALLVAYTRGVARVGAAEVAVAAGELEQGRVPLRERKRSWLYRIAAGVLVAASAAAVAFVLIAPLGDDRGNASTNLRRGREVVVTSSKPEPAARARPRATREQLLAHLAETSTYAAAVRAMSGLVRLWTGQGLTPAELEAGSLSLDEIAGARDLRYLPVQLDADMLEALDLPAIIELRLTKREGESRYALLERLDSSSARVRLDQPFVVPRGLFEALWTGRAHILWRDAERLGAAPLRRGSTGSMVTRLQTLLTDAGVLSSAKPGLYDKHTEQAVRAFQHSRGLVADGVAGRLTKILLYNAVKRFDRPALAHAGVSAVSRKNS